MKTREGELGRRVSPRQLPAALLLSPFLVTPPLICLLLSTTSIIKRDQSHQGYTGHVSQFYRFDTELGHLNHLLVLYQLRGSIIMSLALCKALSALSFWNQLVVRTFSSSMIRFADAGHVDKTTEGQAVGDKEKEAKARRAASQRAYVQRIRADPERYEIFKRVHAIASKKQYQHLKRDPERYEEFSNRRAKQQAIAYENFSWRDKYATKRQDYNHRRREEDPRHVEKMRERSRRFHRENAAAPGFPMRRRLALWTQ
jgi:Skp family chaperone for outer membrane proteins